MKRKMPLMLFATIALFMTGCSQKLSNAVPNYDIGQLSATDTNGVVVTEINGDRTRFEVKKEIEGKHGKGCAESIIQPVLQKAIEHAKQQGFQYIQIVKPASLSNEKGFPINNQADLISYLFPSFNNVKGSAGGLENSIELHSAINDPLTIFGTTSFVVEIKAVKDPKPTDIVWDVSRYQIPQQSKI